MLPATSNNSCSLTGPRLAPKPPSNLSTSSQSVSFTSTLTEKRWLRGVLASPWVLLPPVFLLLSMDPFFFCPSGWLLPCARCRGGRQGVGVGRKQRLRGQWSGMKTSQDPLGLASEEHVCPGCSGFVRPVMHFKSSFEHVVQSVRVRTRTHTDTHQGQD